MNDDAAIGIGTMIIFIAMILVAGIAASVMMQTMNGLQSQAMSTGSETMNDVSSGLKISHVSALADSDSIDALCCLVSPIAASQDIDLSSAVLQMSDGDSSMVLSCNSSVFCVGIVGDLFSSVNLSNLSSAEFGLIVLSDSDGSCSSDHPVINDQDRVAILVNTNKTFNGGIEKRSSIEMTLSPAQGIAASMRLSTPSVFVDRVIQLYP